MEFTRFKDQFEKVKVVEFYNDLIPNPVVSVCIQTFQHSSYIKNCLESILMQKTTFPFEILLGEDGSTDGTREICLDYAKRHPEKIKLFLHHRKNNIRIKGRPTGRFNFLYNYYSSKGKYIALCEGDDYWTDPFKLQKQVDFLENNQDFVIHGGNAVYRSNNPELEGKCLYELDRDSIFELKDFLRNNNLATCTVMFRKGYLDIPKNFFHVLYGDWFLYNILLRNSGSKAFRMAGILAVYREHIGGITNQIDEIDRLFLHINQIKENHILIKSNYDQKTVKLLNQYFANIFKLNLNDRKYFSAFLSFLFSYKTIGSNTHFKKYFSDLKQHI